MVFNSLSFFVFLAVTIVLYRLPFSWRTKKVHLLLASYLFYAAWNPPFVILLWISSAVDWFAGGFLSRATSPGRRRAWLLASLAANLGILGYFKYGTFAVKSATELLDLAGIALVVPLPDIILPIGISFYTFQSLSYTLDIYLGRTRAWMSPLDYFLYVTFFPQLVAGPIVRSEDFLPQLTAPRRVTGRQFAWGFVLLIIGLFHKVVLADAVFARIADQVFRRDAPPGFVDAWIGTLAFSWQIYCDFAGYSLCAVGLGLLFGFALIDNFHYPYAAIGFSDFWRRWHTSLSTWLRDFLYVPLGGNRRGGARTYVNLMVTMLLGGLWHGASWTFVVWGGLHGLYLMIERAFRGRAPRSSMVTASPARIGLALLTYLLVCVTWVFFRARSFPQAFGMVRSMVTLPVALPAPPAQHVLRGDQVGQVLALTLVLLWLQWKMRNSSLETASAKLAPAVKVLVITAMLFALVTMSGNPRAFIYFQF